MNINWYYSNFLLGGGVGTYKSVQTLGGWDSRWGIWGGYVRSACKMGVSISWMKAGKSIHPPLFESFSYDQIDTGSGLKYTFISWPIYRHYINLYLGLFKAFCPPKLAIINLKILNLVFNNQLKCTNTQNGYFSSETMHTGLRSKPFYFLSQNTL